VEEISNSLIVGTLPSFAWRELRKTRTLLVMVHELGRHMKLGPSEYEARVLTTRPRIFVDTVYNIIILCLVLSVCEILSLALKEEHTFEGAFKMG
jgi:hypothetical protein